MSNFNEPEELEVFQHRLEFTRLRRVYTWSGSLVLCGKMWVFLIASWVSKP